MRVWENEEKINLKEMLRFFGEKEVLSMIEKIKNNKVEINGDD